MSCSSFRAGWEIGGPEQHAASCPGCAEWVAGQRRSVTVLVHLAAELDGRVVPADREAELRVAFRQAKQRAAEPRGRRRASVWTAVAACLVGVLGLALRRLPSPQVRQAVRQAGAAAPVAAALAPLPQSSPRVARPASRRSPAPAPTPSLSPATVAAAAVSREISAANDEAVPLRASLPTPAAQAAAAEDAFYPLLPDSEPAALESGQIVRVQLRPDVLDAAGVPSRSGGQVSVEAEVLVGPDGVARGISLARPRR